MSRNEQSRTREVILLDGGMGRELWYRGVEIPASIWSANALLVAPEVVQQVHEDYIDAGARIITTNTYAIVREPFASIGIEDRYEELMVLACELAVAARDARDPAVRIAGSLPPLQESYRPDLVMPVDTLLPMYREMVELMSPFVDLFICETMSASTEALAAATAAAETGKPVWVGWTLDDYHPDRIKSGEAIAEAVARLRDVAVEGMLANCCMPESIAAAMPELVNTGKSYIGGYANTFFTPPPDWTLEEEGPLGLRDDLEPEPYARLVDQWLDAGANVVGGCCGTRPAHIAEIRRHLDLRN